MVLVTFPVLKKTVLIIIFCLLIFPDTFAQSELKVKSRKETYKTTISANYLLTSVGFTVKDMGSGGSILTWRDIYLNGAYLSVDFQNAPSFFDRSNIGVGFSGFFNGYWTDDDANNSINKIHVSTTETIFLELKYEMHTDKSVFNPKLGVDFNMIQFKNYDTRAFLGKPDYPETIMIFMNMEGFVCGYDLYKLGFYGGVSAVFGNRVVYLEASAQIGIGFYSGIGNWLNNPKFQNPVSFWDYGYYFRGGGDLEAGLKLGRVTLFLKALLSFEINPGLGTDLYFLSDDTSGTQFQSYQFTRASFCAGLKVSF